MVGLQVKILGRALVDINEFFTNLLIFSLALLLFWSPCGNPSLTRLVVNVANNLKMIEKCYKNENELQAALQYYDNKPIVGLQFEDMLREKKNLTKTLKVVVR